MDYAAKVVLGHVPHSAVTDSFAEKGKFARTDSYEKSIESQAGEFPEVCALLKADLLEDVDAYTMFVDNVRKIVIRSNSFVKRTVYLRMSSLIAIMHKTLILATKSMCIDQDAVKCDKEAEVALVAQLRLGVEKIEKLESEFIVLKGFDVFAPNCATRDRSSRGH
ncbi:hypothetical protein ACFX2C_003694 [Malus domestica]